jgi:hypothetical protein
MGASGIALSSLLGTFDSVSGPINFASASSDNDLSASEWTPPQYALPALTILTVPASTSGTTGQAATPATNYVFDAVLKIIHRRTLRKTQHPVLTGANIADHAYLMPSRVTLEIGMSDAMAAYTDGVWVGAATKSVSAWQIIKQLMVNKTLLTLTTRLDTYSNMLVLEADAPDDNRTKHALRATITLEEIVSGSVSSTQPVSARPQTSGSTDNGTVQSVPVNQSQSQQNVLPSTAFPNTPTYPQVPGAGNVSSNSLGQVPNE